jgi:hypothetical protein
MVEKTAGMFRLLREAAKSKAELPKREEKERKEAT